ncbi:MAG: alpha-amylase family glycosyl hydrolase [Bacteroidota bacterium]
MIKRLSKILLTAAVLLLSLVSIAQTNQITVNFRFDDPSKQYTNAFVPGSFNDWGPNTDGRIDVGAPSQMSYNTSGGYWEKDIVLTVGQSYQYKFHGHFNADGSNFEWLTDSSNPDNAGGPDFNSIINVSDPMFFQVDAGVDVNDQLIFKARIFSNSDIAKISLFINDQEVDITSSLDVSDQSIEYISNITCDENLIYRFTAINTDGQSINELFTCGSSTFTTDWAQDAIWYQVFPERFRNGDPSNDPIRSSLEAEQFNNVTENWELSQWSADWYERADWERSQGGDFYSNGVFDRRYGGDLQGVIDKLDYLQELGINAIYFNPVFWGPSLHKYDVASHHHIDPHFGPDPEGDKALIANENENPDTWNWTQADSLFLELLQETKARNIRVIIDGVFNHTGRAFFAFQDLLENQQNSRYADWYNVTSFDNPNTSANEFAYESFFGFASLPEFANDASGNTLVDPVKEYIFDITRRWMDPNGDGNPEDGVDGWRLDAAALVPTGFWAEWNTHVRTINPNAYTTLEEFGAAADLIRDGLFSAAMNYQAFLFPMQGYFIIENEPSQFFWSRITNQFNQLDEETRYVMQNLMDSHDTERLASMLVNNSADGIIDNPRSDRNYNINKPNEEQRNRQKLVALFQTSYIGAPMIYYGTESGMWGANDPDDRMPMNWEDIDFDLQKSHPFATERSEDDINFDQEIFNYYKNVFRLRREFESLRRGEIELISNVNPLMFKRTLGDEEVYFMFNNTDSPTQAFLTDIDFELEPIFYTQNHPDRLTRTFAGGTHIIDLPAYGGAAYSVKGSFTTNYVPEITNVSDAFSTDEDTSLELSLSMLFIEDPDNTFPNDFSLEVIPGTNYTVDGNTITPIKDYAGQLDLKIKVNDGIDDSPIFRVPVDVLPVNDAPVIEEVISDFITLKNQSIAINIEDLVISDPDNTFPSDFSVIVLGGSNYTAEGNTLTPSEGFFGTLTVSIQVSDGLLTSDAFEIGVEVSDVTGLDPFINSALKIYPVPTSTELNFTLDNTRSGQFEIRVLDSRGRTLVHDSFDKHVRTYKGQLNTENLSAGFYFIEITGENFEARQRFIK